MSKLRVAILEDNKILLKDLKQNLDATKLVEVKVWASNSIDFIEKVNHSEVEALILDIDLNGDSLTGIDIANKFNLPVLFVSGKTKDFFSNIEDLNINSKKEVEYISKPITTEKLVKILPKFIKNIKFNEKNEYVNLNFKDGLKAKIKKSDISFLESDKNHGSESNNKRIYFKNRPPELLIDFSFVKMENLGLDKTQFVQPHRSYRYNKDHCMEYSNSNHVIHISAINDDGKEDVFKLPVSDNYRKIVKENLS